MTLLEQSVKESFPKIGLQEAIRNPDFWIVNALTVSRLIAGVSAILIARNPGTNPLLPIPILLTAFSWTADYFDGSYARLNNVCTEFGDLVDHGLADLAAFASSVYIAYLLLQ